MKHFIDIRHLSTAAIESMIQKALLFKYDKHYPRYPEAVVAQLFYENSTRTRVSFELAAKRLGMSVIHLDLAQSSENKGEQMLDTVQNLAAMGVRYFVIRHGQNELHHTLAQSLASWEHLHIINAGEGTNAHPSQALLDIMTIIEHQPRLQDLKIAIVGNIKHSRVARSFQHISASLGLGALMLVAPEIWQPETVSFGLQTTNLREGIKDADVVMCLRVQNERLLEHEHLDLAAYRRDYAITADVMRYAKEDAIIMHPGPINRGIEIDSDVADGKQSRILHQVQNGVFARMAIFDALAAHQGLS